MVVIFLLKLLVYKFSFYRMKFEILASIFLFFLSISLLLSFENILWNLH